MDAFSVRRECLLYFQERRNYGITATDATSCIGLLDRRLLSAEKRHRLGRRLVHIVL